MSVEEGRKWWAFQPVAAVPAPGQPRPNGWPKAKIDYFILAKLAEKKLAPSPQADRRTLVTRAYVDLVGYKPTFEEIQAFIADRSPNAYERLIDRLLASPHYGERWARHWMDVARYGEDNPTSEATNPPYPFAWRYRDWIIEALNAGMPYDRFVKLQLAADLMPKTTRDDMRALGYVGAAPMYHHDLRLSGEVIGTFLTDDWDERIDAVSRGVLGVSVACARCHDHKFDPISQKDYYALMGVFASTVRVERPSFPVDPKIEQRYLWLQRQLFDLAYSINLLGNEGTTFTGGAEKAVKWKAEMEAYKAEATALLKDYPQLVQSLDKFWNPPRRGGPPPAAAAAPVAAAAAAAVPPPPPPPARGRGPQGSTEPYVNAVFEAAQYVDASDPSYTFIVYKAGEPRDMPLLKAGNVAAPGEIVPRGFPAVLGKGDTTFKNGSGRLELAERIFSDAPGLAARVIVNRVWGWHFGRGLVATPSDFGTQGDKPTHPELLDDLAARFIEHGWSLKWLSKEIMLSATYQQASTPREDALKVDEGNALLWRQNPRRLDIESYRDTLLRSAGVLDEEMGGVSGDLDERHVFQALDLRTHQPRAHAAADAVVRLPGSHAVGSGSRGHDHDAAADFRDEQRVRPEPRGGGGENRGGGDRRSRTGGPVVSPHSRARPDGRRDEERAGVSAEGHPAALRASPAVDQRGDFSAMNLKLTRREMIEMLGGGVGLVGLAGAFAGLSQSEVRAAGLGNYAGPALPAKAKHVIMIYLNGGPSQLDMFDPKPALFKYAGTASERRRPSHRARRRAGCCRRRSSSSATDATASR